MTTPTRPTGDLGFARLVRLATHPPHVGRDMSHRDLEVLMRCLASELVPSGSGAG